MLGVCALAFGSQFTVGISVVVFDFLCGSLLEQ